MDTILGIPSNVVGNIIAAAGALAAAVISVLLKRWMEDRRTFHAISKDRRKALLGDWAGTLTNTYVEHGPDIPPYNLHVRLHTVGRKVKGIGTYLNDFGTERLKCGGGFYNADYLQLSYESVSRARIQLASLYFSPRGETKYVRSSSVQGARRSARGGVLEQDVEHGASATQ